MWDPTPAPMLQRKLVPRHCCVGIGRYVDLHAFTSFKLILFFKPPTPLKPAVLHHDALSSIPRSLVALIYQRSSFSSARKFAHQFFLGREVDLRKMLKFRDPKVALIETVTKFGREKPVSRYLWHDPSFPVLTGHLQVTKRNWSFVQLTCLCCWGLFWN